ncbi:unnamed protein product [Phaeothamnion confervicola]
MAGAVDVQMPFEILDCGHAAPGDLSRSPLAGCSAGWGPHESDSAACSEGGESGCGVRAQPCAPAPPPVLVRPAATVVTPPVKTTRRLTVVLDMDECMLHSKFHGPNAGEYRQDEARPEDIADLNSFWVTLDDGDVAQVNKRPGLDAFLEALARDHDTVVFTAAMPDYAGPVLDRIDPTGKLLRKRLYRDSCRQVKGAFLKDLGAFAPNGDLSRVVLVDNNPLSFICQPSNGILVTSFYDEAHDTALSSVLQLIRHLESVPDVRPVLGDMFRLDTLLAEYRAALFDGAENADRALAGCNGADAAAATTDATVANVSAAADQQPTGVSGSAGSFGALQRAAVLDDDEDDAADADDCCDAMSVDGPAGLPLEEEDDDDDDSDLDTCGGGGLRGRSGSCSGADSDTEDLSMAPVVAEADPEPTN